jgi:hypothetical protein
MSRLLVACCIVLFFSTCKKETPAPKPLVLDSKVSMLFDGVTWESNQVFKGTSATAYNASVTAPDGAKWQTAITAQNSDDNYLYLVISYNAKPQINKAYPFQLASFKFNGKEYAGGPIVGTSGTLEFTSVTDTALSGIFSGRLALIEGVSTVAGYRDITEGKFTNIKYNP